MAVEASFCPANLGARAIVAVSVRLIDGQNQLCTRTLIEVEGTECGRESTQDDAGGVASEALELQV